MMYRTAAWQQSRREFLKALTWTGTALYLGSEARLGRAQGSPGSAEAVPFEYSFRTLSIRHLGEVRDWLEQLKREGKVSANETFRKYVDSFELAAPKALPGARSLVVVSLPQRLAAVTFRVEGEAHDILIPTGYTDDGLTLEGVKERLVKDVLKDPKGRLELAKLPYKTLAVQSGLAAYGKNNVTFVDGYGSFHQLLVFATDVELPDRWGGLKTLRLCKGCSICVKACPTQCFSEERFTIDAGRCISLYNELPDPMPDWIDPKAHNALVGCLKCQYTCPANEDRIRDVERIAELTEPESALVLQGGEDAALREAVVAKFKRFPSAKDFGYLSRNARLAWANRVEPRA
jgi:epoxyqueuosine reductase